MTAGTNEPKKTWKQKLFHEFAEMGRVMGSAPLRQMFLGKGR